MHTLSVRGATCTSRDGPEKGPRGPHNKPPRKSPPKKKGGDYFIGNKAEALVSVMRGACMPCMLRIHMLCQVWLMHARCGRPVAIVSRLSSMHYGA